MSVLPAFLMGGELAVAVNPKHSSGSGTSGGATPSVTATATGGSGGYAYAWTVITDDMIYPLTINSPAAASTAFDFGAVGDGEVASAVVRVTVTSGPDTVSANVAVNFQNRSIGG